MTDEIRVVNKRTHKPTANDVYIGRPSKWGNPFVIGVDGNREQVVDKYMYYLQDNDELMRSVHELRGKCLVCWCAPLLCHGDILKAAAEA